MISYALNLVPPGLTPFVCMDKGFVCGSLKRRAVAPSSPSNLQAISRKLFEGGFEVVDEFLRKNVKIREIVRFFEALVLMT